MAYVTIDFDTMPFELSHGRRPRGHGRWAFEIPGRDGTFWHTGLYTAAKTAARSEARRLILAGSTPTKFGVPHAAVVISAMP